MARVNAADERRLDTIRAMFERFGFPPRNADVRAHTVYLVRIGYMSMQVQEDRAIRMSPVPAYAKTYCGAEPTPNELARLHARLGFDPDEAASART